MQRLSKIGLCVSIAWLTAMALSLVTYFAYWPSRGRFHYSGEEILSIGLLGALYVAAIPLLVLGVLALRRVPSSVLSTTVSVSWLLLAFLLGERRTWVYYGYFPWSLIMRDFVQPLPLSLAVGLAFGLAARAFLGPNNSIKPTWLRHAAYFWR